MLVQSKETRVDIIIPFLLNNVFGLPPCIIKVSASRDQNFPSEADWSIYSNRIRGSSHFLVRFNILLIFLRACASLNQITEAFLTEDTLIFSMFIELSLITFRLFQLKSGLQIILLNNCHNLIEVLIEFSSSFSKNQAKSFATK